MTAIQSLGFGMTLPREWTDRSALSNSYPLKLSSSRSYTLRVSSMFARATNLSSSWSPLKRVIWRAWSCPFKGWTASRHFSGQRPLMMTSKGLRKSTLSSIRPAQYACVKQKYLARWGVGMSSVASASMGGSISMIYVRHAGNLFEGVSLNEDCLSSLYSVVYLYV